MSQISVNNLTFSYNSSFDNIFQGASFVIDTNWKLGFIGRNGRGKATFLKILIGELDYSGKILSSVKFDYFPFEVKNQSIPGTEVVENICPNYEFWELCRETSLLGLDDQILFRQFETLSNGEQTKVLLAALFLKENTFLLIDEPTNHLDSIAREAVSTYLSTKKGFILVSHDRHFLDSCIDHVLSINCANIEVQQGNFSSWIQNKEYKDSFEISENEKLKKHIKHLEKSAKQTANWSDKAERSKKGTRIGGLKPDKGRIGHKAAKMMKRSIVTKNLKERAIDCKSKLLRNVDNFENLKLNPLTFHQNKLIEVSNLSVFYGQNQVCKNVNFGINNGDRIILSGNNGCGKSTILKLILGEKLNYKGTLNRANGLKISYVSQTTPDFKGNLEDFCKKESIDQSLCKAILRKLDFPRIQFSKDIENFSCGQKKKLLIAKSLCKPAHIYIWDEPLNFIDVLSRTQIENLILEYTPTMILVEHDKIFKEKIATNIIKI